MKRLHHAVGWPGLTCVALFICGSLVCSSTHAASLRCRDISALFITPDTPATLVWQYVADGTPAASLDYTIHDYAERVVTEGSAPIDDNNQVELSVKLPRGYYAVEFSATKQQFGIVAIPSATAPCDPFFSIDGALSWLVPNTPLRENLIKILHRSGTAMVRERLNWGEIESKPGIWDWEGNQTAHGYDTLRHQLIDHHVPALEVFHNAPAWTGLVEKYPEDLVQTARSWTAIARHWQAAWGALEVWNEPDIFFGGNLPADQYVAVVKTLAWACTQAGMKSKLVGGVVARFDVEFQNNAARNGMLDLVDVASFHTYGRAESMQDLVERFRIWTTEYSHGAKPLWLTECGRPWKRGAARPEPAQDQTSALDITMKGIEARACGIARYFAFVYPYYEERDSNFGMMGRAGTPLRSMAAYVECAARLGHLDYLGDFPQTDPRIQRTRVFGDGQQTVITLYTGKIDPEAVVNVGIPVLKAAGIDGRTLAVLNKTEVPIPDGLTYVTVARQAIADKVRSNTAARKLYETAAGKDRDPLPAAPVVVRFQYDSKLVDAKTQGYRLRAIPTGQIPFTYRVFNLDDRPHDVSLTLNCVELPHIVTGMKETKVHVDAQSHTDVTWQVDLSKAYDKHAHMTLYIKPQCDTTGKITPTVISIMK